MFGANLKKNYFFFLILLQIFLLFVIKNVKNAYYDQHSECSAQKHWSKYSTGGMTGQYMAGAS